MLPPWLVPIVANLPLWVQWLLPGALQIVLSYLVPLLLKAFPGEAALIQEFVNILLGKPMSKPMRAALQHFKEQYALENPICRPSPKKWR